MGAAKHLPPPLPRGPDESEEITQPGTPWDEDEPTANVVYSECPTCEGRCQVLLISFDETRRGTCPVCQGFGALLLPLEGGR